MGFGLKNRLRFRFASETCLNYPFLNIVLVWGISSQNSSDFSSQNSSQNVSIESRPQGPFPDGTNKHGNLMFSALVFSSRRRVMLVSNVDAEEFVLETDPKFREIALSGGIIGRGDN